MRKESITQAELKELLDYDPLTGIFKWKVCRGSVKTGSTAGRVHQKDGYIQIKVMNMLHMAHRLAWLYIHGVFPPCQLDHINGDRRDNRINNLREAPNNCVDNGQNLKTYKNNSVGYAGVCFSKTVNKFLSRICANGRRYNLGYFDTAEEAYAARLEAQKRLWPFQPKPRD
jgi:hypothetical protein